ncbi:membrane protein [Sporolactobacillus putidus]|uniref:Membrane protein n=1 Tax=Sporolactobacillus putidus TaxID=492735 RepID=A0A917S412_9BACL|nr:membrane protein [Sporolactobacillus putidus]
MSYSQTKATREKNIDSVGIMIGWTLRIGIAMSSIMVIFGLILFYAEGQSGYEANRYPTHIKDIIQGCFALKSYGVILTGLLLLMLTPVFRVGISIIAFLIEKDYLYAVITLIVFFILIISFYISRMA